MRDCSVSTSTVSVQMREKSSDERLMDETILISLSSEMYEFATLYNTADLSLVAAVSELCPNSDSYHKNQNVSERSYV